MRKIYSRKQNGFSVLSSQEICTSSWFRNKSLQNKRNKSHPAVADDFTNHRLIDMKRIRTEKSTWDYHLVNANVLSLVLINSHTLMKTRYKMMLSFFLFKEIADFIYVKNIE